MITLRAPARTPSPPRGPSTRTLESVIVRHPHYDDAADTLLTFAPTDIEEQRDGSIVSGVQFHAVHTACALVANNRFDGWIATDRAGTAVVLRDHEILAGSEYWFHVPVQQAPNSPPTVTSAPEPKSDTLPQALRPPVSLLSSDDERAYPVVAYFRAWSIPSQLPSHFADCVDHPLFSPPGTMPDNTAVRVRDVSCRLTAAVDSVETAHLIPSSERDWFGNNNMARHAHSSSGRDAIDSQFNKLLLREDVHTLYDKRLFSLIPKADGNGAWSLTAHINNTLSPTVVKAHHNRRLKPVRGVVPEFVFARYAWDILPGIRPFLQGGKRRRLVVLKQDGTKTTAWHSGEECRYVCEGHGRGRSTSPPKRRKDESESGNGEEDFRSVDSSTASFDSGVSGLDANDDKRVEHEEEEEDGNEWRVRPRKALEAEAQEEKKAQARRRDWRWIEWEEGDFQDGSARARNDTPSRGRKRRRTGSCEFGRVPP